LLEPIYKVGKQNPACKGKISIPKAIIAHYFIYSFLNYISLPQVAETNPTQRMDVIGENLLYDTYGVFICRLEVYPLNI